MVIVSAYVVIDGVWHFFLKLQKAKSLLCSKSLVMSYINATLLKTQTFFFSWHACTFSFACLKLTFFPRVRTVKYFLCSLSTERCTVEWRPTAVSCVGRASWTASVYECTCCHIQVKKPNQSKTHNPILLLSCTSFIIAGFTVDNREPLTGGSLDNESVIFFSHIFPIYLFGHLYFLLVASSSILSASRGCVLAVHGDK